MVIHLINICCFVFDIYTCSYRELNEVEVNIQYKNYFLKEYLFPQIKHRNLLLFFARIR